MARVLLDVIALFILVMQLMAFVLKRDKQDKYTLWPLAVPPLLMMFALLKPSLGTDRIISLSLFEKQTLAYLLVVFLLALLSRMKDQAGHVGFWLASLLNMGIVGYLLYFSRLVD